jgi:sulfate-transporting ATPase
VVGGIGFIGGAFVAGVGAVGGVVPYLLEDHLGINANTVQTWLNVIAGVAVIDVMVRNPDGAVAVMARVKDMLAALILRRPSTVTGRSSGGNDVIKHLPRLYEIAGPEVAVLQVKGITVDYGSTRAVDDVDLDLYQGLVTGVIGPNGAGKTTLIDALTGFVSPSAGTIALNGSPLDRRRPASVSRLGLVRTFQNLELFEDLTVRENLLAAMDGRDWRAYATDWFHPGSSKLSEATTAAVNMLGLVPYLDTSVADLPQGQRRMTAIARVVAQSPKVICLDEPAAGMTGTERRALGGLFRSLASDFGAGLLLVEHNVDLVADVCDRLIVLNFGRVIARGETAEVLADPVVVEAYLGRAGSKESSGGRVTEPAAEITK